jgi:hypothetical protein
MGWLRIDADIFASEDVLDLVEAHGALGPALLLYLLCRAKARNRRGELPSRALEPRSISRVLRCSEAEAEAAIADMRRLGILDGDAIAHWSRYQIDVGARERVANSRNSRNKPQHSDVTVGYGCYGDLQDLQDLPTYVRDSMRALDQRTSNKTDEGVEAAPDMFEREVSAQVAHTSAHSSPVARAIVAAWPSYPSIAANATAARLMSEFPRIDLVKVVDMVKRVYPPSQAVWENGRDRLWGWLRRESEKASTALVASGAPQVVDARTRVSLACDEWLRRWTAGDIDHDPHITREEWITAGGVELSAAARMLGEERGWCER